LQGTPLTKSVKTDESELQTRNGQEHQRVYDPTNNALLQEILAEMKDLNYTLKLIHNMEI
jgi:hypothetical protein